MSNVKLFRMVYIPNMPFQEGELKLLKKNDTLFELIKKGYLADNFYRFVYSHNEGQILCFYITSKEDNFYRYLFIEVNELYDVFVSRFVNPGSYSETLTDVYLEDDFSSKLIFDKLSKAIHKCYDENTLSPVCHIYGQALWHENAVIVANRTALEEIRDVIDVALKYGEAKTTLSPSDDEAYNLFVSCVDDHFGCDSLDLPYHDAEFFKKIKLPNSAFKRYKFN